MERYYLDWTPAANGFDDKIATFALGGRPGSSAAIGAMDVMVELHGLCSVVKGVTAQAAYGPAPGAETLCALLGGRSGGCASAPVEAAAVVVVVDELGLMAIGVECEGVRADDAPRVESHADSIALVAAHLVKRGLGDPIGSRRSRNGSAIYEVEPLDAVPVPLAQRELEAVIAAPPLASDALTERTVRVLAADVPRRLHVRPDAQRSGVAPAADALNALARRSVSLRDRLFRAIDIHQDIFRHARPVVLTSAQLGLSVSAIAGIFLGVLLSHTFFTLKPVQAALTAGELFDPMALGLAGLVELYLLVVYLVWDVRQRMTAQALTPARWLRLQGARLISSCVDRARRYRDWIAIPALGLLLPGLLMLLLADRPGGEPAVTGQILVTAALVFLVSFQAWVLVERRLTGASARGAGRRRGSRRASVNRLGRYTAYTLFGTGLVGALLPKTLAEFSLGAAAPKEILVREEAGVYGLALLVVAFAIYSLCSAFQERADQLQRLTTSNVGDEDVEARTRQGRALERAREKLVFVLRVAPPTLLAFGYLVYAVPISLVHTPLDLGDAALYHKVLGQVGWALPVLSFGILAQAWNRFGQTGTLTLLHEATVARLTQVMAMMRSDGELVDRLKRRFDKGSDEGPSYGGHLPDMAREAGQVEPKVRLLTTLQETVRGAFLRRSAVVAASILALLQVDPLKSLEPNSMSAEKALDATTGKVSVDLVVTDGDGVVRRVELTDHRLEVALAAEQRVTLVLEGPDGESVTVGTTASGQPDAAPMKIALLPAEVSVALVDNGDEGRVPSVQLGPDLVRMHLVDGSGNPPSVSLDAEGVGRIAVEPAEVKVALVERKGADDSVPSVALGPEHVDMRLLDGAPPSPAIRLDDEGVGRIAVEPAEVKVALVERTSADDSVPSVELGPEHVDMRLLGEASPSPAIRLDDEGIGRIRVMPMRVGVSLDYHTGGVSRPALVLAESGAQPRVRLDPGVIDLGLVGQGERVGLSLEETTRPGIDHLAAVDLARTGVEIAMLDEGARPLLVAAESPTSARVTVLAELPAVPDGREGVACVQDGEPDRALLGQFFFDRGGHRSPADLICFVPGPGLDGAGFEPVLMAERGVELLRALEDTDGAAHEYRKRVPAHCRDPAASGDWASEAGKVAGLIERLGDGREVLAIGFADSTGQTQTNLTISRYRAEGVRRSIVARMSGGARPVFSAIGRGEEVSAPLLGTGRPRPFEAPESRRVEVRLCDAPDGSV